MIASLVRRTTHAFYPRLQSLYVSDQKEEFRKKYRQVGLLTLSVGLIASGIALAGNRTFVGFLAGPDFFSGNWSNMWFAIGILSAPGFALFEVLLLLSGALGKTALFAPLKAVVGLLASYLLFKAFGIPGVAATFAFLPLIYGLYAYRRGAHNCGFRPSTLGGGIMSVLLGGMALAVIGGMIIACLPSGGPSFLVFGRFVQLPGPAETTTGLCLALAGALLANRQLRLLAK
jgi:O-antigen/teichoic acid export membrane protein